MNLVLPAYTYSSRLFYFCSKQQYFDFLILSKRSSSNMLKLIKHSADYTGSTTFDTFPGLSHFAYFLLYLLFS